VAGIVAELLECPLEALKSVLASRSITTGVGKRGSVINIPLDMQAVMFFIKIITFLTNNDLLN
jgi:hypothetical protein